MQCCDVVVAGMAVVGCYRPTASRGFARMQAGSSREMGTTSRSCQYRTIMLGQHWGSTAVFLSGRCQFLVLILARRIGISISLSLYLGTSK